MQCFGGSILKKKILLMCTCLGVIASPMAVAEYKFSDSMVWLRETVPTLSDISRSAAPVFDAHIVVIDYLKAPSDEKLDQTNVKVEALRQKMEILLENSQWSKELLSEQPPSAGKASTQMYAKIGSVENLINDMELKSRKALAAYQLFLLNMDRKSLEEALRNMLDVFEYERTIASLYFNIELSHFENREHPMSIVLDNFSEHVLAGSTIVRKIALLDFVSEYTDEYKAIDSQLDQHASYLNKNLLEGRKLTKHIKKLVRQDMAFFRKNPNVEKPFGFDNDSKAAILRMDFYDDIFDQQETLVNTLLIVRKKTKSDPDESLRALLEAVDKIHAKAIALVQCRTSLDTPSLLEQDWPDLPACKVLDEKPGEQMTPAISPT